MSGSSQSFVPAFTDIIIWLVCVTVTAISWHSLLLIGYVVHATSARIFE